MLPKILFHTHFHNVDFMGRDVCSLHISLSIYSYTQTIYIYTGTDLYRLFAQMLFVCQKVLCRGKLSLVTGMNLPCLSLRVIQLPLTIARERQVTAVPSHDWQFHSAYTVNTFLINSIAIRAEKSF